MNMKEIANSRLQNSRQRILWDEVNTAKLLCQPTQEKIML